MNLYEQYQKAKKEVEEMIKLKKMLAGSSVAVIASFFGTTIEEFGKIAALKGTDIVAVPLEKAVGKLKTVPKERYDEAKLFFE